MDPCGESGLPRSALADRSGSAATVIITAIYSRGEQLEEKFLPADIGVAERRCGAGLAQKPLDRRWRRALIEHGDLERYLPDELRVLREEYRPHRAAPQEPLDTLAAELLGKFARGGCPGTAACVGPRIAFAGDAVRVGIDDQRLVVRGLSGQPRCIG